MNTLRLLALRCQLILLIFIGFGITSSSANTVATPLSISATCSTREQMQKIGGIVWTERQCKIESLNQRNNDTKIRHIENASLSMTFVRTITGGLIGDEKSGRGLAIIGFEYIEDSPISDDLSRIVIVELLANGSPWKIVHSGIIYGSIKKPGEKTIFSQTIYMTPQEFKLANGLRITLVSTR